MTFMDHNDAFMSLSVTLRVWKTAAQADSVRYTV